MSSKTFSFRSFVPLFSWGAGLALVSWGAWRVTGGAQAPVRPQSLAAPGLLGAMVCGQALSGLKLDWLHAMRRHPRSAALFLGLLALPVLFTWRLAAGPFFEPSAQFRGSPTFAQTQALKERGCTLVGSDVQGFATEFYCRDPKPGVYPARQLIESLPRTGWVLLDPSVNPSAQKTHPPALAFSPAR